MATAVYQVVERNGPVLVVDKREFRVGDVLYATRDIPGKNIHIGKKLLVTKLLFSGEPECIGVKYDRSPCIFVLPDDLVRVFMVPPHPGGVYPPVSTK